MQFLRNISQMDPVSIEELCNITPLASLYKVGWALSKKSADLHYPPLS